MTNVPKEIRGLWTELYTLFDMHFRMDTYSGQEWEAYWDDAVRIWEKYGKKAEIQRILTDIADLIINYSRQA